MTRVKRGYVARKRRKTVLKFASGFRGAHSRLFRTANQQKMRVSASSCMERNNRKREFRRLWIARINAATRINRTIYHTMINDLYRNQVYLDRKTLAQIAILDTYCFSRIVQMTTVLIDQ
uniref:Large ribosomal subunit protein bL20c n=1 Tax=Trichomanes trollii TaxID=1481379 RepID=A0A410YEU7_9MONI|nr:ribosomal protein L20 [Trichomanes trollii]QAV57682.1 ribosomal protein L20 [Trichomanes trollii]